MALSREGHTYQYSEWLDFECEGKAPSEHARELAEKFTERAVAVATSYLRSQRGPEADAEIEGMKEDAFAWKAYASVVGHGVGLWEEDGDTGLPGETEGILDKIIKKDKTLRRLAVQISVECSSGDEDDEANEKAARDFDSPDDALAKVYEFLGAEFYTRQGDKIAAYIPVDLETGQAFDVAQLFKAKGLYHWPDEFKRVRNVPANARPTPHPSFETVRRWERPGGGEPLGAGEARRRKPPVDEKRAARQNVYEALWKDPEYVRLQERKDSALHEWNQLDAYKNHPRLAEPEKLARALERSDAALKAVYEYEDAAMARADIPVGAREGGRPSPSGKTTFAAWPQVRFRFDDETEWQTSSLESFLLRNNLYEEDERALRGGDRVTLGGGAAPLVHVELVQDNPQGREPLGVPEDFPLGGPSHEWTVTAKGIDGKWCDIGVFRTRAEAERFREGALSDQRWSHIGIRPPDVPMDNPQGGEPLGTVTVDDEEALRFMQHWWAGQGDPLYAIASNDGIDIPRDIVERALSNSESDLRSVKKLGGGKYQLGRGTFSKKDIGELETIRGALEDALLSSRGASSNPQGGGPLGEEAAWPDQFDSALKVGDRVRVRWTWGHETHAANARVTKLSKKSLRAALLESYSYGPRGGTLPAGREIVVPRTSSAEWSQNNGAFPPSDNPRVGRPLQTSDASENGAPRVASESAESDELLLYANNTSELYAQKTAIRENLKKKMKKGSYEPELAVKAWMYWLESAAKRYVKELGGGAWNRVFPMDARREAARELEPSERAEMEIELRRDRQELGPRYAKENPVTDVADALPWVKISRDPERYAAALKDAATLGPIDDPGKIFELLGPGLLKEDQETFIVVLLDVRQQCRGVAEVHRGSRSRVSTSVVDVMRIVVASGAEGFVVVHNHPSGKAIPSPADKELTEAIDKAAKLFSDDVFFVDHVVIGAHEYYSFADKKLHKAKGTHDARRTRAAEAD